MNIDEPMYQWLCEENADNSVPGAMMYVMRERDPLMLQMV